MVLDQRCRSKNIPCLHSMDDRFVEQPLSNEPSAGAGVQLPDLCVCIQLPHPVTQQVPEELMVAKPDPFVVQRHKKEIGSAHCA